MFVGLQTLDATIYQKSISLLLLLLPWSRVMLHHSSCVSSPFLRIRSPAVKSGRGGRGEWGGLGAKEKQPNGHLPMMQGNQPQDDWKVRMSHFPLGVHLSIPPRYRWVPVRSGSRVTATLPAALQSFQHGFPSTVCKKKKTARRAIWLWVMEGGLISPSEILEPVGKPQLFKCRKSWFYKMLIRSALGTGELKKSRAPPRPHLSVSLVEWRKAERGGGGGGDRGQKGGGGKIKRRNKRRRRTNYYLIRRCTSVFSLHLVGDS